MPDRCPIHNCLLVCYCPACRGQIGGRRKSEAKTHAARENAKLTRGILRTRKPKEEKA